MRAEEKLRVWITDTIGWWSAQAAEPLCRSGHDVTVFSSVDELPASDKSGAVPDVIVYACAATTRNDLDALARLTAGPWLVIVVVGEIDVTTTCSLYECGVVAIGARYDPPAKIVRTIERASRSEHMRRARKAVWSIPA